MEIADVSDTALWVAHYRALETLRPDAVFRDPLAKVLVGERGVKIAQNMTYGQVMEWVMVMRTSAIDRLILNAIDEGIDTVVNLGAGLDTRPYRMDLPKNLRWVEIDFPHMIEFKDNKLKEEQSVCHLDRIPLDLSHLSERTQVFKELGAQSKGVLVITEGVIPYLSNEQAASLADDLAFIETFKYWIQDYHIGNIHKRMPRSWMKKLKAAPFQFTSKDWFGFFKDHGWVSYKKITTIDEAERLDRPFPFIFPWSIFMWIFRAHRREKFRNMNGYVMLRRC